MKPQPVLLAIAALAAGPALACYTVYDAQNRVVYNAQEPPFDMSRPLHENLARAYPGAHLVFGEARDCPQQSYSRGFLQATSLGHRPLLTDARTAIAMRLPHTVVADGIVLVPDRPADMRPGVVLAESQPPAGADTRAMGAAAAVPASRPAPPRQPPRVYRRWQPAPIR
ncbi:hypothetical protein PE066_18855 [Ramlibacter tataouinensis]|uniref:hypothetical protein n=1 Tax=Ramlibacter tataouinensis TaxID=94132 RepID=UPI0022F39C94|nr:hypothetical protein [Ramlibacter tataouinensis]WBY01501.1 hypothetical protein PE066_18855 [Ramlibacter tataouinensis]